MLSRLTGRSEDGPWWSDIGAAEAWGACSPPRPGGGDPRTDALYDARSRWVAVRRGSSHGHVRVAVPRLARPLLPAEAAAAALARALRRALRHGREQQRLLPPTLRADAGLLRECLAEFPPGTRVAVEPRHDSWWTDEVRALLERYGAALCWADRGEQPIAPLWRTVDWGYLRLHTGAEGWAYRPETLQAWAERLAETYGDSDVLVYFNNDPGGAAVTDAVVFAEAVRRTGRAPTRVPTADQATGRAWAPPGTPQAGAP